MLTCCCVDALWSAGVPGVLSPQDGTAPLWIASQMGHSDVVRVMLLRGADRDAARNVSWSDSGVAQGLRVKTQALKLRNGTQLGLQLSWVFSQPPPAV